MKPIPPSPALTVTIAADHPAFDGHFPGQPVLPGVVLLDLVLAGLEAEGFAVTGPVEFRQAKFHHRVGPGDRLQVRFPANATTPEPTPASERTIDFTIDRDATRIASGRLVLLPAGTAGG